MMATRYYGYAYEGIGHQYAAKGMESFENPYDALKKASELWDKVPDNHYARLLVVMRVGADHDDKPFAFFQFTGRAACQRFAEHQEEIEWSNFSSQRWNGDAAFMTGGR